MDKCQDTAAVQGVSAMPTFIFYRNKAKIDRIQGADLATLESKIQQHIGSGGEDSTEDYGQGLVSGIALRLSYERFTSAVFNSDVSHESYYFSDGFECVHNEKPMRMPQ